METIFSDIMYILHHNQFLSTEHILHLKVKSTQIESENEQNPYIWSLMGIDHSNLHIHSTTILCDAH